jgi:pimeloyl-ACP methyl ester carboxylesterase
MGQKLIGKEELGNHLLKYRLFVHHPDKEWVVFIHGIGGDSGTFFAQLKAFKEHFNLLFPDLRGHGLSKNMNNPEKRGYSLGLIAEDMFRLMDSLGIQKSHFVGGSFGAILIREMQEMQPDRFLSVVMAGAVLRLNPWVYTIFSCGKALASVVNNYFLYKMLAYYVMPRRNHRQSRREFIIRSVKIDVNEYKAWMIILKEVKHKLDRLYRQPMRSPTLLIMGSQDHTFLNDSKRFCKNHPETRLLVIPQCGHLSNIEKYKDFNKAALNFFMNGQAG